MEILLTGANGFIGSRVIATLLQSTTWHIRPATRVKPLMKSDRVSPVVVGDLDGYTDWSAAVRDVKVVIHTAARVHMMREVASDPLAAFRRVNVDGTINLARQAAEAGVKRFIFLSSIKVNGEHTLPGRPYLADDVPHPMDAYGQSKWEAELALFELGNRMGMEIVVIRPVLVYGPGVKANFEKMMKWVRRGLPLPLGAIRNQRSLVAVGNLADLIRSCVAHERAAGEVFLVSDGDDVSTTDLLRHMGTAIGKSPRLINVPERWLRWAASLLRRPELSERLCGWLQVDISKNKQLLNWTPPFTLLASFHETAADFEERSK